MILLKILLFIILAVFGIIILALLMPVSVKFSFIGEKVEYKVKYSLLNVIDSEGGGLVGKILNREEKPESEKKKNSNKKNKKSPEKSASDRASEETVQPEVPKQISAEEVTSETAAQDSSMKATNGEESTVENAESESAPEKKKKKTLGEMVGLVMGIWQSAKRPLRKILKGFHFSDIYIDFLIADEDAYKCAINYGRICTVVYNGLSVMSRLFTVKLKTIDVECGFAQEKSRWDASVKVWFIPMTAVIAGIWFLITYIFRIYLPNKIKNKKSANKQKTQPQGGM